jgi:1-acyl-sn-glycerol-3-phosphate acyltransferase
MSLGLFDLVAVGGTVATRSRFRFRMLTGPFELPPRSLLLFTHRSDWDIPLTTNMYWAGRMWRRVRPVFVARDDLFLPGFLGGYPPGLPLPLRRLLGRTQVGGVLRRHRLALPVASAGRAHLADVALDDPELPLSALPAAAAAAFRDRARWLGRPEPRVAGDVLDGGYVDLLWRRYERPELPGLDGFWGRRQAVARSDFAALLEHVARGGSLVVYPEGQPSPDGAIGPLQRGLGALVDRAQPDVLLPGAIAYDPLGPGRTRAYLAIGEPFDPPRGDADEAVLAALRRLTPLTAGQVAARAELHGLEPERVAAEAADGRPAEPRLRELLPVAVAAARQAPRRVLERLDLELRSAHGL